MNISKFTFSEPNDSGYISLSLDAAIENKSEFDIELVDGLVIIVDANGVTIGGAEIFPEGQKVSIASKESGEICVFGNSIQKGQVSDGIGAEVKAYLSLNSYRRVSVEIGSLDVPNEPGEMTAIKKVVSLGDVGELVGISCLRLEDHDNGEMNLSFSAGVRNTSDDYIPQVHMAIKPVDHKGAKVGHSLFDEKAPLAPKSGKIFNPGAWDLYAKDMKNGAFIISLSFYLPVENYSAEATPVKED